MASPNRTRSVGPFAERPRNATARWPACAQGQRGAEHQGPAQLSGSDRSIEHGRVQLYACFPKSELDLKLGTDWGGAHISPRGRTHRVGSTVPDYFLYNSEVETLTFLSL